MIRKLSIRNYVLIKNLEMQPSEGLTIITGETGAGKSIMLGAVGLLMGNRADTRTLLNDEEKCIIEGWFDIKEYGLQELFTEHDIDYEDQTIIRREITPSGKSRAFVNDTPVRLEFLRELSENLVDVHSQRDTFDLGEQYYQVKLLDSYAGNEALLMSYGTAFEKYVFAEKHFRKLTEQAESIRKDQDYNQFLFQELEALDLQPGEQEKLEEELSVLENAEEIKSTLAKVSEGMAGMESGLLNGLAELKDSLKRIESYSQGLREISERMESSFIELKDLSQELEAENEQFDFDPQRAEDLNSRLSEIYRLQQKHKVSSLGELLEIQNELSSKLSTALNLEEDLEKARKEAESSLRDTQVLGKQLSDSRKQIAGNLCKDICNILDDLSIPNAQVNVRFEETDPTPSGTDNVEFTFSANKGVSPESLRKVASGGEFSRLMFAVKYIMAGKTAMPTIIFDEIDTGISGEIAKKMGFLMKEMGAKHQIVAITHLPQIAARGHSHFFVYKDTDDTKTSSHIRLLSEEERIDEIAKMIAGDNPSESALQSARELVKD